MTSKGIRTSAQGTAALMGLGVLVAVLGPADLVEGGRLGVLVPLLITGGAALFAYAFQSRTTRVRRADEWTRSATRFIDDLIALVSDLRWEPDGFDPEAAGFRLEYQGMALWAMASDIASVDFTSLPGVKALQDNLRAIGDPDVGSRDALGILAFLEEWEATLSKVWG